MNACSIVIEPPDAAAQAEARALMDGLSKPIGSLGLLEDMAVRVAGITGRAVNDIAQPEVIVMAADNGVWDEGISPVPQSVTALQARLIAQGRAGVSVLARQYGVGVSVADIGVKEPVTGLVDINVMRGTHNIAQGAAMTRKQCEAAIQAGYDYASSRIDAGVDALGVGEMGICNTATSSAVLSVLLGADVDVTVGLGAGVTPEGLERKRAVVGHAIAVNRTNPADTIGVMAALGGLDIAGMAGVYLAAAHRRIPAVIDGFISTVAALCAARINPAARYCMFGSHRSEERGFELAARALDMDAPLHLGMRLGEGSGTPFMLSMLRASCALVREMAALDQVMGDASVLVDVGRTGE